LLINNSGFGSLGCFLESDLKQQVEMVDVNIRAVVDLTARLLPTIVSRGGGVINLASTAAFQSTPGMATYGATKAFLLHWSVALREEMKPHGVRVVAVCPGPTSTGFGARAGLGPKTVPSVLGQTPQEVAAIALRGFAADRAIVVCGFKNRGLAWFASHAPRSLSAHIAGRVIARVIRVGAR
jgi:short-subunit dehydrogenase